MTEQLKGYISESSEKRAEIKYPQTTKVEVGPGVDFVYIMRKDGNFAVSPVAEKLAHEHNLDDTAVRRVLLEEYDNFFHRLASIFSAAFINKGNFELHLYEDEALEEQVRIKAEGIPIVSLDPLIHGSVYNFEVSRGFYMGGIKDFGQVNRPGSDELNEQSKELAGEIDEPICVIEDDIFSGGSVIAALDGLTQAGLKIQKVIPGIQIGKPTKLDQMGLVVDPAVEYETTNDADIFDKVDLGDPRDFLLGASGLVIKLPNGNFVRAPYILPFVSTAARAGIPQELEKNFAVSVLQANIDFFQNCEQRIGCPILLRHMDSFFVRLISEYHGLDEDISMAQVTYWALENMDQIWEHHKEMGKLHESLDRLKLPTNIIFLDVNGTLIPEDSTDGSIDSAVLEQFENKISLLEDQGISVGLCSDSPLPQLINFGERLGIKGPIIAENGNIVYHNGDKLVVKRIPMAELSSLKDKIEEIACSSGYGKQQDVSAPEFGGVQPDYAKGHWGFGANRETTISVFAPESLIAELKTALEGREEISIDSSPQHNYFAIHPGDYQRNKGETLSLLCYFGHRVLMVGNSMSDWVDPSTGVKCAFVGESRITDQVASQAVHVSTKKFLEGVNEIISEIIEKGGEYD